MSEYLSERSMELHRQYLVDLRLKYSIFVKSYGELENKSPRQIAQLNLPRAERERATKLLCEILMHEMFFASLGEVKHTKSTVVERAYGSLSNFLNEIYKKCMSISHGYVACIAKRGMPCIVCVETGEEILCNIEPILVMDVSEHVYFLDYGFDKNVFLINALPYLNTYKIDQFFKIG